METVLITEFSGVVEESIIVKASNLEKLDKTVNEVARDTICNWLEGIFNGNYTEKKVDEYLEEFKDGGQPLIGDWTIYKIRSVTVTAEE